MTTKDLTPTDPPTDEREMAREALVVVEFAWRGLRDKCDARAVDVYSIHEGASSILLAHGPCPGFWGEVLAAVRLLGGDAPFEPAAILAALRAVVGAADV